MKQNRQHLGLRPYRGLSFGRHRYAVRRTILQGVADRITRTLALAENILIVAPHPDDETFGTGRLIATARRTDLASRPRSTITVVFLTSGNASHRDCCEISDAEVSSRRELTAARAATILGVPANGLRFLRLSDGALPQDGDPEFERVSSLLLDIFSQVKPQQVFTTNAFEGWPDHMAADQLTRSALRQSRFDAALYHYCVWFWIKMPLRGALTLGWSGASILQSPGATAQKETAIRAYLDDLAPCGHPYCGRLPGEFLSASKWDKELFFHVPRERW